MKDFKSYLYNEVPMPLESIPKSQWDPELHALAQAKAKGQKGKVDLNPITPELKKEITDELTAFFETTIADMKAVSVDDISFIFENSGKIQKAYVRFPTALQKRYQTLMEFFFVKADINTLENNFRSGDRVKAERNKIGRKIKTLQAKEKQIQIAMKKAKKNETDFKKLEAEEQIVGETITALQDILKTEINSTLRYVVGSIVEKYTGRSSSTTFNSISFDLEKMSTQKPLYRTHFPQGIPNFLKGSGLGYKLYVALANKLEIMLSARNATVDAKAVWLKLLTELKGYYAFFIKHSALRGVIKETISDAKLKAALPLIIQASEELFETEKNYEALAEIKILTRMLTTNKKFKSMIEEFGKLKDYDNLINKIETKRTKTKDIKQKAELNALLIKIKKLKIKPSIIKSFEYKLKIKDFIDEVSDTAFKERLTKLYKKDLELLN